MKYLSTRTGCRALPLALLLYSQVSLGQQRSVDLEVACISPADTVVNGIGARLRFGIQNNGPDLMYNRDTTLYWLEVKEGDTLHWYYQGAMIGTSDGIIDVGELTFYNDNYAIQFPFPNRKDTFTVDFCVIVGSTYFDKNGNAVNPFTYIDPDRSNNKCCTAVTIVPKRSGTSIGAGSHQEDFSLYPNPARNRLYIRRSPYLTSSILKVAVVDLSGRLLLEQQFDAGGGSHDACSLDVAFLPAGLYHVRIQSPEGVVLRKIVIGR